MRQLLILFGCAGLCAGLIKGPNFELLDSFESLDSLSQIIMDLKNPDLNPEANIYQYDMMLMGSLNRNILPYFTVSDKRTGSSRFESDNWVVVECGLVGSHWNSIHACVNLLRNPSAIEFPATDPNLISNVTLLVIPMANPVGYSLTETTDRLYSKNGQTLEESPLCDGIHLNRNFDYQW